LQTAPGIPEGLLSIINNLPQAGTAEGLFIKRFLQQNYNILQGAFQAFNRQGAQFKGGQASTQEAKGTEFWKTTMGWPMKKPDCMDAHHLEILSKLIWASSEFLRDNSATLCGLTKPHDFEVSHPATQEQRSRSGADNCLQSRIFFAYYTKATRIVHLFERPKP
jgi:hypothetical protein